MLSPNQMNSLQLVFRYWLQSTHYSTEESVEELMDRLRLNICVQDCQPVNNTSLRPLVPDIKIDINVALSATGNELCAEMTQKVLNEHYQFSNSLYHRHGAVKRSITEANPRILGNSEDCWALDEIVQNPDTMRYAVYFRMRIEGVGFFVQVETHDENPFDDILLGVGTSVPAQATADSRSIVNRGMLTFYSDPLSPYTVRNRTDTNSSLRPVGSNGVKKPHKGSVSSAGSSIRRRLQQMEKQNKSDIQ